MTKIAFTDHIPFPEGTKYEENSRMNYKEADEYLTSIASLAKKYEGKIDIEAGFEFEYAEGKYLENILQLKALIKDKTGQDGKMILGQHWVEVEKEDGKVTYVIVV